jgi:cullin 3
VYTKSAGVPEIWDEGLLLFIRHIIKPPIQDHLTAAVLVQIQTERNGFVISRSAVKGCVDVLLELQESLDTPDMYRRILEPVILKESEAFYKAEGEQLLEICDASEYLRRASVFLDFCVPLTHIS